MRLVLKIIGGVALVLAMLAGVAAVMLNSSSVQNRMAGYATGLLQEKLNARVRIDSVHVSFLMQKALVAGLEVDDQQQREMLCLDRLSANFGLWNLLHRKVTISNVEVSGVRARLYKETGQPANYQFVLDAFKKDQSKADDAMTFKDIKVTTDDQRLDIVANGNIKHLTDKERLAVRFHVNKMTAKGNVKREVINQFAVKKFMMKQLDALGTIGYTGDIAILRQQEKFSGLLRTAAGAMNLTVTLNEATKYVSGSVRTSNFQLGKVIDMPDIGTMACEATFKFDYSVPRTQKIRLQRGGKLPIGSV